MGSFNDFQWHLIFTILNPDQSYPFQKNIANKVTLNIEAAFKQELQKQAYLPLVQSIYQYWLCFK